MHDDGMRDEPMNGPTHWALERLGLDADADADERAVKRAYAARLKTTRPDSDPEGFQRLHEAYQAALAWVRSEREEAAAWEAEAAMAASTDASTDAPPDAQAGTDLDTDAVLQAQLRHLRQELQRAEVLLERAHADRSPPPQTPPRFAADETDASLDLGAFLDACLDRALRCGKDELRAWLQAQPALWSLQRKAMVAQALLQRLAAERLPIPQQRFDAIAAFFGLDDLHGGYDAYTLHRLRHRLHLAWEVHSRQTNLLAERTALDGGSVAANVREVERILNQLTRPLRWPQALWAGLLPGFPGAVRRFLHRLDFGDLDDLPPPIRDAQVAFWNRAGDRERLSQPRLAVVAARLFAYSLIAAGLWLAAGALGAPIHHPGLAGMPTIAGIALGLFAALWLGHVGFSAFGRWQAAPERWHERWPWLRRLALPAVLTTAMLLLELAPPHSDAAGIAVGLLLVLGVSSAWRRHRERSGPPLGRHFGFWRTSLLYVVIYTVGTQAGWFDDRGALWLVAGAALFIWARDLWHQRHALRH
jgi:hypothetical protein